MQIRHLTIHGNDLSFSVRRSRTPVRRHLPRGSSEATESNPGRLVRVLSLFGVCKGLMRALKGTEKRVAHYPKSYCNPWSLR
jgi:hypothetical protein